MVGVLATAAFAVEFSSVARRGGRIVVSFAAGLIAFAVIGWAAQGLAIAPIPLYAISAVVLIVALRLVPDPGATATVPLPRWDLPARMVLATALVLAITSGAGALGPRLSGLLATIPLYASILAGFGFQLVGPAAAIRVWRGLLFGLFGFGAFYLVLAASLESIGLAAFGLALLTAAVIQVLTLRVLAASRAEPSGQAADVLEGHTITGGRLRIAAEADQRVSRLAERRCLSRRERPRSRRP